MPTRKRALAMVGPRQGTCKYWGVFRDGRIRGSVSLDVNPNSGFASINGNQVTDSQNHPGWNRRKSGSFKGDLGGPFTSIKREAILDNTKKANLQGYRPIAEVDGGGGNYALYQGPYLPIAPSSMTYPAHAYSSDSSLEKLGTTAIARCSPTNPTSDVSTFLGELLTEGIPHVTMGLLKSLRGMSSRRRSKALADQYLNYQFGWVPFVNDILSIGNAVTHSHDVLSQFERDSGKMVRRRYEFPPSQSTTSTVYSSAASPWISPSVNTLVDAPNANKGQVIQVDDTTRRQWFSGGFTYYVPMGSTPRERMARYAIEARKLYGLSLTPDSIWNLAPWSWAVDWFSNAGDYLHNLSAWEVNNQVLWYGYMMEHTIVRRTYTFVGRTGYQSYTLRPATVTLVSEAKIRRQATPFGFGFNWDGLSAFQKTIIAALGISRGGR